MGQAEYIVRFKGDYSALQKDINKIAGETKKLSDDEVIIKLAYDGNIKEFNKTFDTISNMHPELGIQFQYNINQKMLEQELNKIDQLTEIKLDVDENKVQTKLKNLADNVDTALQGSMSKDEITKRLKNVFAYYNTAVKAGAKNINFDSITNRLYDSFSVEADEIKNIFDDVFDLNDNKKFELFKLDKSVFDELSEAKSRAEDIRNILKSLEEKGASKTGLPSELQKVQDEIKILRSDIQEMQEQLKDLSGEAFTRMSENIKETNRQLDITKERLKVVQDFLKNNGDSEVLNFTEALNKLQGMLSTFYKENNGNHVSSFWDELIQKAQDGDEEVLQLLSDLRLLKDDNLPNKVNAGMVKSGGLIGNDYTVLTTKIHSDNFSGDRLKDAEELKKRLDAISESGVNAAKTLAIVSDEASNLFVEIQETAPGKMLGQIYGQTEEDWVNTDFFEATDAEILKLIVDLETLRKAGIGVELNTGNLLYEKGKGFTIIDMDLEPLKDYEETISEAQNILFDSIRQFYELQTDESGNITAEAQTAITALDNFSQKFGDIAEKKKAVIDQLSTAGASNQQITINDAAKEASQKAADALQEAQDSNSPAELTKPLGKDFGLGYAEGIREAMPEIVEACKEIVLAAYDAVKETSDAKNGEGNNFLDNFINNLKESLDNAAPTIQEKIKEVFSKINIDNNGKLVETFKDIIQEAIDGLGAFPIEVKPYIRKGSEIEEVDLPGGGQDNLLSDISTPSAIDEITQAEDRMGNEAQEATDQARQGLAEMREEAEILLTIYRGVDQAATQFATINDKPGTFFSFDKNLAKQYAGFSGELLEATADFKDALYIDGKGSDWYNFEYLGNGADEASQKIIALSQKIRNIQEELSSNHWKELGDIGISHSDFTRTNLSTGEVFSVDTPYYMYKEDEYDFIIPLIEKENALESIHNEEVKQLVIELYEAEKAYKRISDAQDNMYGRHSTDEFAELGKKNGYNSIIFENIKDSFDKISSVSDVGVILDNAIIKQDQFTNSINETTEALKNQASNETTNLSSGTTIPSQQFNNEVQQNLVMLENYENTIKEIDKLKVDPETDEAKHKIQELNKLADYFASQITVIRSENGHEVNRSMMYFNGVPNNYLMENYSMDDIKRFTRVADERTGLNRDNVPNEFFGIEEELSRIEHASEGLRNALTKNLSDSKAYVSRVRADLLNLVEIYEELEHVKEGSRDYELYQKDIGVFSERTPEVLQFLDKIKTYDQAYEFVKMDEWLDFLATLPQAHTYLESIGYDFDKINRVSNETPVSTESTEAETKALLSKKEVVEQLRTELNLTKKAAEDLFDQQGYAKTNSKYQLEQTAVNELIASFKEKKQVEESQDSSTTSSTANAMQSEVETVNQAIDAEKKKFNELKNKISKTIPTAINKKNQAFEKERDLVAKVVDDEVDYFDVLKDSINSVTNTIEKQYDTTKNAKPKADKSNNKSSNNKSSSNKSDEPDKDALLQQHYVDLRKDAYQSFGQKSDIQKEMSKYYSQLEKESSDIYSSANKKANGLLDKIKKFNFDKYTQDFVDELKSAESELTDFLNQLNAGTIPLDKIDEKISVLATNINDTLSKKALGNVKKAGEKTLSNIALKIDQIIAKNSAMGKQYEDRFKGLRKELEEAKNIDVAKRIIADVNQLESEIINAGKTGISFIDQIKQRLRDMNSKYIAQYFSFQDIIRYARQAVTNVVQLNDAFIELSKVSNTSLEDLESDFQSYANTAKDIGGTITDTISATADWSRLGYNVPDSKELAEVAMLYKNVGDGIDINTANESLISTLRGFKMEADDAISVVDKFNEVSNNFAISSGGIGESLQRSAAAFSAANTDLSQSIALITATNEVVQDPDAVGSMWTTVSARIRGAKSELEDMGEDTEDMVESTSKLRDLVKGITGVDIMLDENTFKDIYTIITQIGDKWNEISDIDQAALLEALAGKRQANRLAAVLGNLDHLKEAYQTAEESAGSARREQENFEKGITYSINQAKATLEELSYDAINSDFLKGLVNTGTKLLEIIDKIIDKFGLFKSLIIGGATVLGSQKLG